jgi:hypothetical protein
MSDQELDALMQRHSRPVGDLTAALRDKIKRYCSLEAERQNLEERLDQIKKAQADMASRQLPDLFAELGVTRMDLEAQGNMPAYEAILKDYYRASIPASWSAEQKDAAFAVLEKKGLSGLVKNTVTARLHRDSAAEARKIVQLLANRGISADLTREVHWQTLTAALREMWESGRRFTISELDAIGAVVGKVVSVKVKES